MPNPTDHTRTHKIRFTSQDYNQFVSLIDMGGLDECWPWQGKTIRGKAVFKTCLAQHMVMSIHDSFDEQYDGILEVIPSNQVVFSTCGSNLCCNPNHLRFMPYNDYRQFTRLPGEIDDTHSIYEVTFPDGYRYMGVTNMHVMTRVMEQMSLDPPWGPTWELYDRYRDQGTFTVKILESGLPDRKSAVKARGTHVR